MGNYNPHRPAVLGNEWVPIKYEPYDLDQSVERGYTFELSASTTIVSGAVYFDKLPDNATERVIAVSVYREGEEALTGPLQSVILPPVSGIPIVEQFFQPNFSGHWAINGIGTGADVLKNSNDYLSISVEGNVSIYVFFDVSTVQAQLDGKRIHDIRFHYSMFGDPPTGTDEDGSFQLVYQVSVGKLNGDQAVVGVIAPSGSTTATATIDTVSMGNIILTDPDYDTSTNPTVVLNSARYTDLLRFRPATATSSKIALVFEIISSEENSKLLNPPAFVLTYAAMEIIYSEETRLLTAGRDLVANGWNNLESGQRPIPLRKPDTLALGATLSPGRYTVTTTEENMLSTLALGDVFKTKAIRQLDTLLTHPGVEVVRTLTPGKQFQRRDLDVIPAITLHTASTVVTGVHSYAEQVVAQVDDDFSATQEILQQAGASDVEFPWVRFYARRWGTTKIPLTFSRSSDATTYAQITSEEFDALPEIVDGWKEVTLRLNNPPLISNVGGTMTFQWTANNLHDGSRWEILGARSINGAGAAAYDTDVATYGGTTAHLLNGALISTGRADGTLIFSQDPPTPTDLAVDLGSLTVTSIGQECSVSPECVPTSVEYNTITWTSPSTEYQYEDFEDASMSITIVSGGSAAWFRSTTEAHTGSRSYESGNISDGQASQFTVTIPSGAETISFWYKTSTEPDFDTLIVFRDNESQVKVLASGEQDWTFAKFEVADASTVTFRYTKDVSDSTGLDTVWVDDIYIDMGYELELQRSDDADDEWQTIMRTGDLRVQSFNDYEARIGVTSYYSIRTVNALNFPGEWSATASRAVTAPGVGGAGDGNSVLIFTSNEQQDGSAILAYVMSWESSVSEDFAFPEAGDTQLQKMYNRDFVTAFRPLERGGEQFSRTIIVQNAAVSTGRMRDGFRSLRDLAWDSLSYVCVRNELGDRWLSNVQVPSGKILRNRRLYVAQINITEVTDTPSEVDPSA